jgi:hypothetical protein
MRVNCVGSWEFVMTAFGKWRDLIVFDVFAFPSLVVSVACVVCLFVKPSSLRVF